jgi:hypothetical protein
MRRALNQVITSGKWCLSNSWMAASSSCPFSVLAILQHLHFPQGCPPWCKVVCAFDGGALFMWASNLRWPWCTAKNMEEGPGLTTLCSSVSVWTETC